MTVYALRAGAVACVHRFERVTLRAIAFLVAGLIAATVQFDEGAEAVTQLSHSRPVATGSVIDAAAQSTPLLRQEIDGLLHQIMQCWNIPTGWTDPKQVTVVVRFQLNRDGTVHGIPNVELFSAGPFGVAAAESAVRAVLACAPYKLPADKYDQWRVVQMSFKPE